jgi:hypothetical protein
MLVGSLCEDLGERLRSWTHINTTMTRKLVWPTLIGPFSVLLYLKWQVVKKSTLKNVMSRAGRSVTGVICSSK